MEFAPLCVPVEICIPPHGPRLFRLAVGICEEALLLRQAVSFDAHRGAGPANVPKTAPRTRLGRPGRTVFSVQFHLPPPTLSEWPKDAWDGHVQALVRGDSAAGAPPILRFAPLDAANQEKIRNYVTHRLGLDS